MVVGGGGGGDGDSQLRKYTVRDLPYDMLEIRQTFILGLGLQHLCIWSRSFYYSLKERKGFYYSLKERESFL